MSDDMVSLTRFAAIADAHGGAIARWPVADRAAAMRLTARPEARAVLEAAGHLDCMLDAWIVPAPATALRDLVLRGAPRMAPRGRPRLWWSGLGLAAALAWDTHAGQTARLAASLKALDTMLATLRDALGPVWAQTTVVVATEFGRTAAANGTGGTDHGTASAAMLVGGAVRGGRVIADWPGLGATALYQQRDLAPTAGLDALIAGAAAEALALDPQRVAHGLFTDTRPMTGLIAA